MEKNQTTEERIIEVAKQLFVEKGYTRTSMSDIANQVGINRSTLHYYFRTKEKMFEAVFGLLVQSFLPKLEVIVNSELSLHEKFEKIIDEYIEIYLNNPFLPQFILGEIQRDTKHLLVFAQKMGLDYYLLALKKTLDEEAEKGHIKEISLPILLITFFGQLVSPFLLKNILSSVFINDEAEFRNFLEEWKQIVLNQIWALLYPQTDKEK